MSERRDDTTEADENAADERERAPQNYYYDDGTNYEVYDPDKDEEEGTERNIDARDFMSNNEKPTEGDM